MKDYVKKFYEMKKQATIEGNGARRCIAKLFLNTLYGKLLSKINEGDWWKWQKWFQYVYKMMITTKLQN